MPEYDKEKDEADRAKFKEKTAYFKKLGMERATTGGRNISSVEESE